MTSPWADFNRGALSLFNNPFFNDDLDDFMMMRPSMAMRQLLKETGSTGQDLAPITMACDETDEGFNLSLGMPGIPKDNVQVKFDDKTGLLHIKGEHSSKFEDESGKRSSYRSFSRSFPVDTDVINTDNIKAEHKDGLLKLSLPKKAEGKRAIREEPRSIAITDAA